ncbi:MAG TPA: aminoacetone oxidase family FAD-binding enzyme [Terracidiphilus sp.]|nr:aminoacetone oxidase family FAD-binding enzyme [Terracidiphilus sp.]
MPTEARKFDVVVIGAGAAGMMCAAVAGQRGRRVALLEHNAQPGRKVLISGGGRANFTNIHAKPENYISDNPHFVKSALALYTPRHFLGLVERYSVAWHEKTLGQLFCDGSARQIVDLLLAECTRAKDSGGSVELICNAHGVRVERRSDEFAIACTAGEFRCAALVIATGGLSIPQLGATGFAYETAKQFGLNVIAPRPALVPLVLSSEESAWTALTGVSAMVEVRAKHGPAFREKLLVTHRGLSGPAVLQVSSYWREGEMLAVDFGPGTKLLASLFEKNARRDAAAFRQVLRSALPQRLAGHLAETAMPEKWTNAVLEETERRLHAWTFHPAATEGFAKAEVTAGGVDTRELNSKTMEARKMPGLFFIGEGVDVTGWLGGFNFQWAWSSSVAAGRAV